jgi:putative membrane-bound dehydrogenase-like protein
MPRNCSLVATLLSAAACLWGGETRAHDDPPAKNTQPESIPFTTPEQALADWKLPPGFSATLFAAEPQVTQPISMSFDERGRLWVAECDSYSDREENFSNLATDRIVVFTDADNDGKADERKVFWNKGRRLTSALPGFGGIWALDAPRLLYFRDENRDDVPDGEPQVLLDGFNDSDVRHNIVNGLMWGPDGWLYGRHGILSTSMVGAPGTPQNQRTPINCGVWRYHPVTKAFEVVAYGTTNPWGMDYNEHGEMFMINTVIGHLWHVVPGAHFQRMYGSDFDPYLYRLLPQTADHFHWDTVEAWSDIRKIGVSPTTDKAGGGHAHCGLMIYQGENWPAEQQGKVFTVNLHGRRLNCDRLERAGCGYVGKHDADICFTSDPWFRGIELVYGPDGGVYLADWSDIGECHDNDGIHRTSGRLFKFVNGKAAAPAPIDLRQETPAQLVEHLKSKNEWFVRQARLQLQERTMFGSSADTKQQLEDQFHQAKDSRERIATLLAIHVTGDTTPEWCVKQLARTDLDDEHVRSWLVRFLAESGDKSAGRQLAKLAATEKSGLVRLYLASSLQKLPAVERFPLAQSLASHAEDADDPWQPLMIWYGVNEAAPADPLKAVEVAATSKIPLVREFIIRRVMESGTAGRAAVVQLASTLTGPERITILRGMVDGLRGVRKTEAPAGWAELEKQAATDKEATQLVRELGAVFGDGRSMDELRATATSAAADAATRTASIHSLVEARAADLSPLLTQLLSDRDVAVAAIRGLATVDPAADKALLQSYAGSNREGRTEIAAALASRPAWAGRLLAAIDGGQIEKADVEPFLVRQMMMLNDAALSSKIAAIWPDLQQSGQARQARISELRSLLSDDHLQSANRSHGRAIFDQNCAKCHKLFGEGASIGPDLTGAQRSNLNYLLENIVDPSLTVAASYRISVLQMADGRVLNGVVSDRTEKTLNLQTPAERLTIPLDEIEAIRDTNLSLMPEGQLDVLAPGDVRDLVGYLMSPAQVSREPK